MFTDLRQAFRFLTRTPGFTALIVVVLAVGIGVTTAIFSIVNGVLFRFGPLINAVVTFVMVAAVVYFLIVLPVNMLIERSRKAEPPDPTIRKCPECLSDIPTAARRCRYCGQPVTA